MTVQLTEFVISNAVLSNGHFTATVQYGISTNQLISTVKIAVNWYDGNTVSSTNYGISTTTGTFTISKTITGNFLQIQAQSISIAPDGTINPQGPIIQGGTFYPPPPPVIPVAPSPPSLSTGTYNPPNADGTNFYLTTTTSVGTSTISITIKKPGDTSFGFFLDHIPLSPNGIIPIQLPFTSNPSLFGTYSFQAQAFDSSGNGSALSNIATITINSPVSSYSPSTSDVTLRVSNAGVLNGMVSIVTGFTVNNTQANGRAAKLQTQLQQTDSNGIVIGQDTFNFTIGSTSGDTVQIPNVAGGNQTIFYKQFLIDTLTNQPLSLVASGTISPTAPIIPPNAVLNVQTKCGTTRWVTSSTVLSPDNTQLLQLLGITPPAIGGSISVNTSIFKAASTVSDWSQVPNTLNAIYQGQANDSDNVVQVASSIIGCYPPIQIQTPGVPTITISNKTDTTVSVTVSSANSAGFSTFITGPNNYYVNAGNLQGSTYTFTGLTANTAYVITAAGFNSSGTYGPTSTANVTTTGASQTLNNSITVKAQNGQTKSFIISQPDMDALIAFGNTQPVGYLTITTQSFVSTGINATITDVKSFLAANTGPAPPKKTIFDYAGGIFAGLLTLSLFTSGNTKKGKR